METNTQQHRIALQLVGSPTSKFFFDLSLLYAKEVVQPNGFELLFAVVYPDGQWSVSKQLDDLMHRISLSEMIELVQGADIVVPHIFCQTGLTSLRIFFEDVLNIPVVGSSGHTLNVAQDKQLTKLLAADIGVRVPKGVRVTKNAVNIALLNDLQFPLIVKPNSTDNSDGLTLVKTKDDLPAALTIAFHFDKEVLVEEFIAGREIRAAIIEKEGHFEPLPFIEYLVNKDHPIRKRADKYKFDAKGELLEQSAKIEVPAQCPAIVDEALQTEISVMMTQIHQGLGCRDFSMYDFRIHEVTGKPYLLEAGLFWSFSEASMISTMLRADSQELITITEKIWRQAAERPGTSVNISTSSISINN